MFETAAETVLAWVAGISIIAAVIATAEAIKYAKTGKEYQRKAEKAERRHAVRDVTTAANAVLVKTTQLIDALDALDRELVTMAVIQGADGRSTVRIDKGRVQEITDEAEQLAEEGRRFAGGAEVLSGRTLEEIAETVTELATLHARAQDMHAAVLEELTFARSRTGAALDRRQRN